MAEVIWAGPAWWDLQGVHAFIARDSRRYAQITVRKIRAKAASLGKGPLQGSVLQDPPDTPYREVLVGSYRIIYRYDEENERVYIVAVVQGSRDLPTVLKRREKQLRDAEDKPGKSSK